MTPEQIPDGEPLRTVERHATRAGDWADYGHNLAEENYYMGGQFADARRLMLDAWEGWTSGEPDPDELVFELLATWWAMCQASGLDAVDLAQAAKAFTDRVAEYES